MPALRSVIAHLRRNPAINPAERHRIEDEALDRRHDRERRQIDRRAAALDKIEARERRGLILPTPQHVLRAVGRYNEGAGS